MDILSLTAVELATAIREKRVTAVEAMQAVLSAIKEQEPNLNCYVTVDEEGALKRAALVQEEIEKGRLNTPLAGVPVAIK
ncbi:MAG: amidase family protein, partial [Lachnospiraceae bacterium]